ncbi:DsbA family protein [Bosea sp. TWI1241]|uniref:DsbA family protein n=1 Tax=Bosea sp. TWI1241 TaxID=3148904 RepID=UPI003208AFC9
MNRRSFLAAAAAAAAPLSVMAARSAQAQGVDVQGILNDPEAPTGGNPKGDVTVVAFFDYNCPYCKVAAPVLARVVKEDGRVRLVYKDWPILSEASVYGAQLALAAKRQRQYERAHHALMGITGRRATKEAMLAAVQASGIDMARLQSDLTAGADATLTLLRRNHAQADSLGLQGTPTYLVGPFRTSTLDEAGFRQAIADAREKQAAGQ